MMPQLSVAFVMPDTPREARAGPLASGTSSVWGRLLGMVQLLLPTSQINLQVHDRPTSAALSWSVVNDRSIGLNLPADAVSFEIGFCFSAFLLFPFLVFLFHKYHFPFPIC
jgi:hypothetical protein